MHRKKTFTGIFMMLILFLTACSGKNGTKSSNDSGETLPNNSAQSEKLTIITTFYPMYEFTRQVAGDLANITMMVPAGTDTHHFEPSAKNLVALNKADLFIYNSPEMETWVPDVLKAVESSQSLIVVEAAENITLLESSEDHEEEGHTHEEDPHVWLDPVLAQYEVETIKKALQKADPENAEIYEENAATFIAECEQLHTEFQEAFSGAKNRMFVTQHAAFGYLAARYNLTQLSIAGLSAENEPSPAQLAKLHQMIQKYEIPVIYQNSDASSSIADTLSTETGVPVEFLYSLESVTSEEIENGADYLSLMRKNLDALKKSIH